MGAAGFVGARHLLLMPPACASFKTKFVIYNSISKSKIFHLKTCETQQIGIRHFVQMCPKNLLLKQTVNKTVHNVL